MSFRLKYCFKSVIHSWLLTNECDIKEEPILWPPDMKNQLTGKDLDAGKDWRRQDEKTVTNYEMVGWHHWLNAHSEFEQALGDNEGQESLACCSPKGKQRVRHSLATKQ